MKLKLMSYNIQHGRDHAVTGPEIIDLSRVADVIRAEAPDVCGLNEVRGAGPIRGYTDQIAELKTKTGMNGLFGEAIRVAGTSPYGNGLLTREVPLKTAVTAIPDPPDRVPGKLFESRCVIQALLPCGFTVFVSHFGLNPSEAKSAVDTIINRINACETPFALLGDFNLTPDSPLLQPLYSRLKDTGALLPENAFSFPSDAPRERIDYIFVSPQVRVISARVPVIVASDHCPYLAEVEF